MNTAPDIQQTEERGRDTLKDKIYGQLRDAAFILTVHDQKQLSGDDISRAKTALSLAEKLAFEDPYFKNDSAVARYLRILNEKIAALDKKRVEGEGIAVFVHRTRAAIFDASPSRSSQSVSFDLDPEKLGDAVAYPGVAEYY